MGQIIDLPSAQRPRGAGVDAAASPSGAQILLFTGVWRERYDIAPAAWSSAKGRAGPKSAKRDAPKGPSSPTRGKKRA